MAFFGALFAARTDVYAIRLRQPADRQVRLGSGDAGRVPQGSAARRAGLPAADRRRAGRAPVGRDAHRPVPAAGRRQVLVAGRRLRRPGGDDRRPHVRQGRPRPASPGRPGGLPVRGRRARMGVLHRPGSGRDGPPAGHRAAARGDGAARPDDPGQLRPAVPVPGPAARRRGREPDRRAAVQASAPERRDGLPGPGDPGTARGPVGLPVLPGPDDPAGSEARRRAVPGRSPSPPRSPSSPPPPRPRPGHPPRRSSAPGSAPGSGWSRRS